MRLIPAWLGPVSVRTSRPCASLMVSRGACAAGALSQGDLALAPLGTQLVAATAIGKESSR